MKLGISIGISATLLASAWSRVGAWHTCNESEPSAVCPDGNMCCLTSSGSYSCISGHNSSAGVCCSDTLMGTTGCGEGFECAMRDDDNHRFCRKTDLENKELPDTAPRYRLCTLQPEVFQQVHGLEIVEQQPKLAYLSSMSAIDSVDEKRINQHLRVETLIVMVHGSGRNVDDYICSTYAATPNPETTLIVAPWFLAPEDGPVNITADQTKPLVWAEDGPIWHTWRYGADAMNANVPVSAYEAVDAIVDFVAENTVRFPKLRRIVVAGHSAGGQFTQRWALLSNSTAFHNPRLQVRAIVANPKSFCYLDARRYFDGVLRAPTIEEIGDCDTYNEWEWGLDEGNFLPTPYKDRAIAMAGGVDAIVQRYATRDIIYLAGEMDVLPNGDCQAQLQGPYRRKRSEHFFASLQEVYGHQVHHRLVVAGVYHNHALMFQSPEGQVALFGSMGSTSNSEM